LLGCAKYSHSTTWEYDIVQDPILDSAKCLVQSPASFGGYIYEWPGKHDQVFWPLTEEDGIWFCNESGFTSLVNDFKDISREEKYQISIYLKENYNKTSNIEEKLKLLEGIYSIRKKDEHDKNLLLRVLARWYQNIGKFDTSNAYRKKALAGIEISLRGNLQEQKKVEYLYLASAYSHIFRDSMNCVKYSHQLDSIISDTNCIVTENNKEYFRRLLNEIPRLNREIHKQGIYYVPPQRTLSIDSILKAAAARSKYKRIILPIDGEIEFYPGEKIKLFDNKPFIEYECQKKPWLEGCKK
jgi:hypothetical protein